MHYPEDLPPNLAELRADYQATLASFGQHLDKNPFIRAEVEPGVRMYAIHMPGLTEYGAQAGDDRLMAVIYDIPMERGRSYTVILNHYGDRLGDVSNDPEEFVFWTDFSDDDLENYDAGTGEWLRTILEAASDNNWFSVEEAWYQVKNQYPSQRIRDAYNAQRRGERRAGVALTKLLIEEIEAALSS